MPTFRTSQPVSSADVGDPAQPHLIVVGLPGAGKTSAGRAAAERLRRQFLDFDSEIERRQHITIAEIFASRGEPYFRKLERALTEELRPVGNMVLSPGGGWMANPGCLEMLRPPALLVYLKVRPEIAIARMGKEAVRRPLLQRPDPLGELRRFLAEREQLYLQANHTVSTDMMTHERVVDSIVALAAGSPG